MPFITISTKFISTNNRKSLIHIDTMPLTLFQQSNAINWHMTGTTPTGFTAPLQSGSISFVLNPVTLATWNQLYVKQYSITHGATQAVVLTGLTNLAGESFSFAHVLTILVNITGANCTIGPGATNPLTWFFGGTTQTVQINAGGSFFWTDTATATGQVVDGTHKQLDIINLSGSATATVNLAILGSTA